MCFLPCCAPPRKYMEQDLGLTESEIQSVKDFCDKLLVQLGCKNRQERGQVTLLAVVHKNVLQAAKESFPQANDTCLAEAIQGIIQGVGEAFGTCTNPNDPNAPAIFLGTLFQKAAPHIGKLISCIITDSNRRDQIELNFWRSLCSNAAGAISRVADSGVAGCLSSLLTVLLQIACRSLCGVGTAPPTPPAKPPGGGCCTAPAPPPGGPSGPPQFPEWTENTTPRC